MNYRVVRHSELRYQEYQLFWLQKDWDKVRDFGLYHEDGSLWGGASVEEFEVLEEVRNR